MVISVPKMKKNQNIQRKILISVNVVGSAGPIRLIVNEDDAVAYVVSRILKVYARQGRLPVLGFEAEDFQLFCPAAADRFGDLDPQAKIGACANARSFMLWKKAPLKIDHADGEKEAEVVTGKVAGKGTGSWKSWIRKSLKVVISAH